MCCIHCRYSLMLRCWDLEPHARPTFIYIVEHLKSRMRAAEEEAQSGKSNDLYTNVPNTQFIYKTANPNADESEEAPAARPLDLTLSLSRNEAEEVSADDYLTPSEHYFSRDAESDYLVSPSLSGQHESWSPSAPSTSQVPTEHIESSFQL